jgi:flagellar biosynthetic protein FliO
MPKAPIHISIAVGLLVAALAAVVHAQPQPGRYNNLSLRTDGGDSSTTRPAGQGAGSSRTFDLDWTRVTVSLGVVLGLIFALRFVMRRYFGAANFSGGGAGRAVRVLGRTPLGPRQQIVLIQVGSRVIVAADSGGAITNLCEITDADEIAGLIAHVSSASVPGAGTFGRWMGNARNRFDAEPESSIPEGPTVSTPVAKREPEEVSTGEIDAARGELKGLMDKIRGMSQQFNRP